jgi:TIR domain/Maltogenic Amylase, C-terminal domain
LLNGLFFSLPGTPVLYYGDEIGMGDNIYLGGNRGVRTPMQWSTDRNAGFSRANPQQLYSPIIIDPEYHNEIVNVESQQHNPNSLLWWMKRLIALRKRFRAFSRGSLEFLSPNNSKVLAFLRRYQEEIILVVANLSQLTQHAYLDLSEFAGQVPTEVVGPSEFPVISERPYILSLGPHSFFWFKLEGGLTKFYSCFISYSSKDEDFAERLFNDLTIRGVRCWFAPHDVRIGEKFRQRIDDSIQSHDKLLLVLSKNSVESTWVEEEVEGALERERIEDKLMLFPVRIDDTVFDSKKAWAASIRRTRHIGDFREWENHEEYQNALARLIRDLITEQGNITPI